METPVQAGSRLLAALEELWTQEATLLQAREFNGACAVLERAVPLVHEVCRLAAEPGVASLRPEVAAAVRAWLAACCVACLTCWVVWAAFCWICWSLGWVA